MAYSADKEPLDLTAKTTPIDADVVIIGDSTDASEVAKKTTWANVKATLKTYFDTLYAGVLGADDNYVTDAEKVKLSNLSGTNTGDQTSIVGITGTKAQFDTAVSDGNILYVGDVVGVSDGDKGDITVSASGATWTIDNSAVTLAKQADMATASVVYRKTAGTGVPEVQTLATLKTDLGLTGTNSGDQTSIVGITGTTAQFNTALSDGDFATGGGTATGTNTGDQTSIVGITGTMAQFDTAVSDGNIVYQSQALGTPSSGTVTNLTGTASININGTVGATTPNTVSATTVTTSGNIELGHATDTTISRVSAGVIAVEGVTVPTLTSTSTFATGVKTFLAGMFALRNVANTFSGFFTNTNTADRTYTLKDADGTLAFTTDITGTNSGTNTGDQTSIVGISGTKAQFDTAVTDGNIMYDGDSITNATSTAHRVFYGDGSGVITELALGADGTFLKSNGAAAAPSFAVPAGSGDVSKVGTPVNNQVGVWTGDGTIEGDADLTFDTTTNTLSTGIVTASGAVTGSNLSGTNTGDQTVTNSSDATSHTVTLSASGGSVQLIEGTNITLTTGGTGSAGTVTIAASGGSGDVTKVGTPVNNQIGIWTGDGTLEGDAALTYDGTNLNLATAKNLQIAGATVLADAAGTTTLSNIDALDATTEATVEAAIDTLANLTSIQGRTVTLADAGANAIFGWDDVAGAYENLTQGEARTVLGLGTAAYVATDLADLNEATIESSIDTLANLTSVQGLTVTLADAGADAILGWDDSANAYENLTQGEVRAVAGLATTDSPEFTAVNIGHASDTTLARASAGIISVEGVNQVNVSTAQVLTNKDLTATSNTFTAASTTQSGVAEASIASEVNTGTDAARYVSPDSLAGSNFGIRYVQCVLNGTTALTTSEKVYFRIPAALTGMNLVSVTGTVGTGAAGSSSSGTPTFTVKNVTDSNQMLSTSLTIDASEYTSATAAAAVAINGSFDDVVTDDLIEVAVTTAGTGVTYATVTLGFSLP